MALLVRARNRRGVWVGMVLLAAMVAAGCRGRMIDDPRSKMAASKPHLDHSSLMAGPFTGGPEVTRECLRCHAEAGRDFMKSTHWTWIDENAKARDGRVMPFGKRNAINNFCIAIPGNWESCTSCHAGYGWKDKHFDFTVGENADCLICHDRSGQYAKGLRGVPKEGVDLLRAARSVGMPRRDNCGACHFAGGGGDAVKHGDLDGSMFFPAERLDVHMGRENMQCVDCHQTRQHVIAGKTLAQCDDGSCARVDCVQCHSARPHADARVNGHLAAVACQTCHVPKLSIDAQTKMSWDWSQAGRDEPDSKTYMKKKGRFTFAQNVNPEYRWYNGHAERYLPGDPVLESSVTKMNAPRGGVWDATARISPFKIHRGKQPYDKKFGYLLYVTTFGEGGYWHDFDWAKALRLGSEASGQPFSGEYGFASTEMHWPTTHMIATKDKALRCADCHGEGGRMDWRALGYEGDPALYGGRVRQGLVRRSGGASASGSEVRR